MNYSAMITKMKEVFGRHPIINTILLYGFYTLCFFLTEQLNTGKAILIHSPIDDLIPFSRYAVIPYCLWFVEIAVTLLYVCFHSDKDEFFRAVFLPLVMNFCSFPLFYLFPTEIHLRPEYISGNDICALLTRFIYRVDDNRNVCPSLHVANCLLMSDIWLRNTQRKTGILIVVLNVIISISTLFLKQHSVIDLVCGCAYAIVFRYLFDSCLKERT